MSEVNITDPRPMLASVENIINNTPPPQNRILNGNQIKTQSGRQGSQGSIDSSIAATSLSSSNSISIGEKHSFPSQDSVHHQQTEPIPFSSPTSTSTNGRPSSVASNLSSTSIMVAASSSHSNLTASLLTPTLASALGITPSARRKKHAQRQNTTPLPAQSVPASTSLSPTGAIAGSSSWSRRPSLPSMPSGESRMSMYSVASFESLPEGECVSHISSSPYTKSQKEALDNGTVYGSSPKSEYNSGMRRSKDHTKKNHVRIDERSNRSPERSHDSDWTKRKNVAMELLETERAFVASLRIVNDHYYQPLVALSRGIPLSSVGVKLPSNAAPTLSKKAINEIFSNFADILHLNSELLVRLEDRLSGRNRDPPNSRPVSMVASTGIEEAIEQQAQEVQDSTKGSSSKARPWDPRWDLIGDLLAPMAPFLKMYSFYVKNFSSALTRIEAERKANDTFARFLKETERLTWMTSASTADNQSANGSASGRTVGFGFGLGLQAHLLSIVQRIPRYKLLVGELMKCTPEWHKDYSDLRKAYNVIEQVAESINDNIRQHEMVLSMLSIQRTLVGMNEPLLAPGRSLLKRATLRKAGRKDIHAREFFLFTDCIIYAAPIGGAMADASAAWQVLSRYSVGEGASSPLNSPTMAKSPQLQSNAGARSPSPSKRFELPSRRRTISVPTQIESHRLSFSSLEGQQLQFRGKFALQDCTVVGVDSTNATDISLRYCIEIRTPGKSFAIYADSTEAKSEWLTAIRNAREELMSNRRTLHAEEDSITAKRERRRSLQANMVKQVTFPRTSDQSTTSIPEGTSVESFTDQRSRRESLPSFSTTASLAAYLTGSTSTTNVVNGAESGSNNAKSGGLKILEDYNAPVWVPDSRADKCACCSESFGLWRRKHHCRLCGQVVCWSCSQRSFLIASYEDGEQDRPARACDTCYESVFPESPEPSLADQENAIAQNNNNVNFDQVEQDSNEGIRNSKALDSDASLPSCPPTPTSPQTMCIITNSDGDEKNLTSFGQEHKRDMDEDVNNNDDSSIKRQTSSTRPISSRQRSVSPSGMFNLMRKNAIDQTIDAPATRIAKAHVADAQVFHGRLLSPQVHAATSGSGTFRLVTPRLTTPEWERPPLRRFAKSVGGEVNPSTSNDQSSLENQIQTDKAGNYFSGAKMGSTELNDGDFNDCNIVFPRAPVRRRKPLSAAARLSSVYGALPASTPNSSTPPNTSSTPQS